MLSFKVKISRAKPLLAKCSTQVFPLISHQSVCLYKYMTVNNMYNKLNRNDKYSVQYLLSVFHSEHRYPVTQYGFTETSALFSVQLHIGM